LVKETGNLTVPLHLRNAPTPLMNELGYGKDYKYAHNFKNHFVKINYMPDKIKNVSLYFPSDNPIEKKYQEEIKKKWGNKYK